MRTQLRKDLQWKGPFWKVAETFWTSQGGYRSSPEPDPDTTVSSGVCENGMRRAAGSTSISILSYRGDGRPHWDKAHLRLRMHQPVLLTFIFARSPQSDSLPSRNFLRCVPSEGTRNVPHGEP